jgi:hypothetical protein
LVVNAMRGRILRTAALALVPLLLLTSPLSGSWDKGGTAVCTEDGLQDIPCIIADGSGSAIIAWNDKRTGTFDIYAQLVHSDGTFGWQPGGVPVSTAPEHQALCQAAGDGSNGAIIVWRDSRNVFYDIYAQRIDASGNPCWSLDGIAVCTATGNQNYPKIVHDGSGGAIVAWFDGRGSDNDIYAQRIDPQGNTRWVEGGVAVCTASGDQMHPVITGDGSGGAIITWMDYRAGDPDIYAQRVDASGSIRWTANGIGICTVTGFSAGQRYPRIVSDGVGGVIITWEDHRSGEPRIYAQRADSAGAALWDVQGIRVNTAESDQDRHESAVDNGGGVIVAWRERFRGLMDSLDSDIYAQRIDTSGASLWSPKGVPACTAPNRQEYPFVIHDGADGAVIAWADTGATGYWDIRAQRLDDSGASLWANDGVVVSDSTKWDNWYEVHTVLAPDASGGSFVVWHDHRGGDSDIYAALVEWYGSTVVTTLSRIPSALRLLQNYPNPFNPCTRIGFDLPRPAHVCLAVYNVKGELVATLVDQLMPAGRNEVDWSAKSNRGDPLASGIYFCRLETCDFVQTKKMVLLR